MSGGRDSWDRAKATLTSIRDAAGGILRRTLVPGRPRRSAVFTGRTMGTYYRLTVVGRRACRDGDALHNTVRERLDAVETRMSTYRPESEVSRFNAARSDAWIAVSAETARVVGLAIDVGRRSGGAYDITAGPLVRLWGFGPGRRENRVPAEAEIAEALSRVGTGLIEVRMEPPAIRKSVPHIGIDLASIAKGFAVDLASEALERTGVRDYCVDVGGEVRVRGLNAEDVLWRVAVEVPQCGSRTPQRIVSLRDAALATSGDYRIGFEQDGVRYAHVLDPRAGHPIRHDLTSVTVLDRSCARADAWATALLVLGPDEGYQTAVGEQLAALFIRRTPDGFTEQPTPSFGDALRSDGRGGSGMSN